MDNEGPTCGHVNKPWASLVCEDAAGAKALGQGYAWLAG